MSTAAPKPPGVDIVAAREHSITSRRTRVHVIVCHDLDAKSHSLFELFGFAKRVSPEVDIIRDAEMLIQQLENIKAFAERQLAKLPARSDE